MNVYDYVCMYGYVYMNNKPVVTLCFCALFSLVFYLSKDNKGHTWFSFSPDWDDHSPSFPANEKDLTVFDRFNSLDRYFVSLLQQV